MVVGSLWFDSRIGRWRMLWFVSMMEKSTYLVKPRKGKLRASATRATRKMDAIQSTQSGSLRSRSGVVPVSVNVRRLRLQSG